MARLEWDSLKIKKTLTKPRKTSIVLSKSFQIVRHLLSPITNQWCNVAYQTAILIAAKSAKNNACPFLHCLQGEKKRNAKEKKPIEML